MFLPGNRIAISANYNGRILQPKMALMETTHLNDSLNNMDRFYPNASAQIEMGSAQCGANSRQLVPNSNLQPVNESILERPVVTEEAIRMLLDKSALDEMLDENTTLSEYTEGIQLPLGDGGRELLRAALSSVYPSKTLQGANVKKLLALANTSGMWPIVQRICLERTTQRYCPLHAAFIAFKAQQTRLRRTHKLPHMSIEREANGFIQRVIYDPRKILPIGKSGRDELKSHITRYIENHASGAYQILSTHGLAHIRVKEATVPELLGIAWALGLWNVVEGIARMNDIVKVGKGKVRKRKNDKMLLSVQPSENSALNIQYGDGEYPAEWQSLIPSTPMALPIGSLVSSENGHNSSLPQIQDASCTSTTHSAYPSNGGIVYNQSFEGISSIEDPISEASFKRHKALETLQFPASCLSYVSAYPEISPSASPHLANQQQSNSVPLSDYSNTQLCEMSANFQQSNAANAAVFSGNNGAANSANTGNSAVAFPNTANTNNSTAAFPAISNSVASDNSLPLFDNIYESLCCNDISGQRASLENAQSQHDVSQGIIQHFLQSVNHGVNLSHPTPGMYNNLVSLARRLKMDTSQLLNNQSY